jgi:hypothetical protein
MSEAMLLLRLADLLAIKVGCDGRDVITVARSPVPVEVSRWVHVELCKRKRAVIKIIEQENEGRSRT